MVRVLDFTAKIQHRQNACSRGIERREQIRLGNGSAEPSDKRRVLDLLPPPVLAIVRPLAFPVVSIGCKTLPIPLSDDEKLLLSKPRIVRVTCSLVLPLARGAARGIRNRWRTALVRAVACVPAVRWEGLTLLASASARPNTQAFHT